MTCERPHTLPKWVKRHSKNDWKEQTTFKSTRDMNNNDFTMLQEFETQVLQNTKTKNTIKKPLRDRLERKIAKTIRNKSFAFSWLVKYCANGSFCTPCKESL